MKILVTGGLGHLGTCLAERLSRGYEVTVLDNCSNHLENYELSDAIRVLKGDIRDYDTVKKALKNTDFIIHAAAQIDVERSIRDPIFDADNNINGALNLLEAARKHNNIKKFIYFSSAAIYGMPTYIPIDEKHPTDPISPYGLSKLTGERYSLLYHKLYNLPVVCIRPFNIYSERQNPDNPYSGVISKFIKQIQLDQPLTIFGDGEQTRDFVHLRDVLSFVELVLENDYTIGDVFNIGTGKPTSINQLAVLLLKVFKNEELGVIYKREREGDIKHSVANIEHARRVGYDPKVSIEKGIEMMLKRKSMSSTEENP